VRDAPDFASGSFKGALNIPIDKLEKQIASLPADKSIVFFCGTGARAGEGYDMLKLVRPALNAYFLNADIKFGKDGSYSMSKRNKQPFLSVSGVKARVLSTLRIENHNCKFSQHEGVQCTAQILIDTIFIIIIAITQPERQGNLSRGNRVPVTAYAADCPRCYPRQGEARLIRWRYALRPAQGINA